MKIFAIGYSRHYDGGPTFHGYLNEYFCYKEDAERWRDVHKEIYKGSSEFEIHDVAAIPIYAGIPPKEMVGLSDET